MARPGRRSAAGRARGGHAGGAGRHGARVAVGPWWPDPCAAAVRPQQYPRQQPKPRQSLRQSRV